uniref:Dehydrin COR47 n=1 Tax=Anthurium amnicola TaxID=1678845 RepID=A0A1D1ZHM9_9ARAE
MADEQHHSGEAVDVEVNDRGLFDFMGKKKEQEGEKCQEEALAMEFEKVQVTDHGEAPKEEKKEEEKKEGLLEKLHRSHSSSSSCSSDEEEAAEGGEEKKKKKKGLKEKIKEKITGEKKEGAEEQEKKAEPEAGAVAVEDNTVPVEMADELAPPESEAQEKKSLMERIKEKLPGGGQQKKPAEEAPAPLPAEVADQGKEQHEGDSPSAKEKKGFLGKIMDKIPGYHKNNGAEETSAASN